MRTFIWLFVALLLLGACGSKNDTGLLVYVAAGEDGAPASELVVVDPAGKELRRIGLPAQPNALYPTRSGYKALAQLPDYRFFLLDAQAGTAQELAVDSETQPMIGWLFLGGGRRYQVLAGPRGDAAYLADLDTGATTDLLGLKDDIGMVFGGLFSLDERYLILRGDRVWLLPTGDPARVRQIGGEESVTGIAFSGDGKQIVYGLRVAEKSTLVVEAVDGSKSEEILSTDEFILPVGFVGHKNDQIVVTRVGSTALLDLDSGKEQVLLSHSGFAERMFSAANRRKLLLSLRPEAEAYVYHLLDTASYEATTLENLTGYSILALYENPDVRWLYFVDSLNIGKARHVVVLDLETGETREVLALDEGLGLWRPPSVSRDSRLALATVLGENFSRMQLWLLDGQTGEARKLGEGQVVTGAISPDNRWVAVNVVEGEGSGRRVTVDVVPAAGGEAVELGSGYFPIWVYP